MRYTLDIETACAVSICTDKKCDHALIPHTARITLIGFLREDGQDHAACRTLDEARAYLDARPGYTLSMQNGSFDLSMLHYHGLPIPIETWTHDPQLMGAVSLTKVPEDYLEWYSAERKERNKKFEKGAPNYRKGSQYSLKVMAPYFLGVEPFWETPGNYDDDAYNFKDLDYTGRLTTFFTERLEAEGLTKFYHERQMPWARQLLQMSLDGIDIDLDGLAAAERQSEINAAKYRAELDVLWAPAYAAYLSLVRANEDLRCDEMLETALRKASAKGPLKPGKYEALKAKYQDLRAKAEPKLPTEVNLGSPTQLSWILRDYFGLDIRDWEDEESTAKAVIQKLIREGRKDLQVFLDWRTESKRLQAFYPTYRALQRNGKLHTSYNSTGARTGRISSSRPNLQQCPPHVRGLFCASADVWSPPDYIHGGEEAWELGVYDESAVEPRLIAYYTEDQTLCELLATGADFHGFNTKVFFGLECAVNDVKHLYPLERKVGKEAGLSILYGAGAKRLQNIALKYGFDWSLDECKAKIAALRRAYPGVTAFKRQLDEMAKSKPVVGYFGQKYFYPNHDDIYMKAFNTLIQGSASQMVVDAACRIDAMFRAEGIAGRVLLAVHDELVVKFPKAMRARAVEIIKFCMTDYDLPTQWGPVKLELEGKVSSRWEK